MSTSNSTIRSRLRRWRRYFPSGTGVAPPPGSSDKTLTITGALDSTGSSSSLSAGPTKQLTLTGATDAVGADASVSARVHILTTGITGGLDSAGSDASVQSLAPGSWKANEPAGFTQFTSRAFNSKAANISDTAGAEGWDPNAESGDVNFTIQPDSTGPISPGNVAQGRYPLGMVGGGGPMGLTKKYLPATLQMYVSAAIKIDANFSGHTSGVNKLFFYKSYNPIQGIAYFSAQGVGTGILRPQIRLQSTNDPVNSARNLACNLTSPVFTRDVWHKYELILTANTGGLPNGAVEMWWNGVRAMYWNDVNFFAANEGHWHIVSVTSIWGGAGGTVPQDMFYWVDHVYASYKA